MFLLIVVASEENMTPPVLSFSFDFRVCCSTTTCIHMDIDLHGMYSKQEPSFHMIWYACCLIVHPKSDKTSCHHLGCFECCCHQVLAGTWSRVWMGVGTKVTEVCLLLPVVKPHSPPGPVDIHPACRTFLQPASHQSLRGCIIEILPRRHELLDSFNSFCLCRWLVCFGSGRHGLGRLRGLGRWFAAPGSLAAACLLCICCCVACFGFLCLFFALPLDLPFVSDAAAVRLHLIVLNRCLLSTRLGCCPWVSLGQRLGLLWVLCIHLVSLWHFDFLGFACSAWLLVLCVVFLS